MKVNIQGRGLVYSLGINAPVKNIDLSEAQIRRILPVRSLQVFDAETNLLITTRNVNELFKLKGEAVVEAIKREDKKPGKKEKPVVVEQVAEPVVETAVEESVVEEPAEEVAVEVNEEAELTADEEEAYEEADEEPVSEAIVDYDEGTDVVETTEEVESTPKKKNKKRR